MRDKLLWGVCQSLSVQTTYVFMYIIYVYPDNQLTLTIYSRYWKQTGSISPNVGLHSRYVIVPVSLGHDSPALTYLKIKCIGCLLQPFRYLTDAFIKLLCDISWQVCDISWQVCSGDMSRVVCLCHCSCQNIFRIQTRFCYLRTK